VRLARVCVSVSMAVALTVSAAAQEFPILAASKDARALGIVQAGLNVMGSRQVVSNQTVAMTGTITIQGSNPVLFPITIKTRGSNQIRSELTTGKGLRVTVFSGGHGTTQQPDGTVRWLADENAASERNNYIPALSLLSEYQLPATALEYVGPTMIAETAVDVIAVGIYAGSDSTQAQQLYQKTRTVFYLDHNTGLVLRQQRLHFSENVQNSSQVLETRYDDWRVVSGVSIPFHQQILVDGELLYDLTLSSAVLNATVLDSDFALAQ
jgi:hypothetical protein